MEIANEKEEDRKKLFYACTVRNEEFKSGVQLRHHAAEHNVQLFCKIDAGCNFVSKEALDARHVQGTHKKPYQCTTCGKAFRFPSYLNRHRMKHIKVENPMNELLDKQNKHKCEICKKKFPFPSYLKRHLAIHANQPAAHDDATGKNHFSCATCGKVFEFLRSLRRHQMHSCKPTDLDPLAKHHKCRFCPNSYRFSSSLCKHKKNCHAEEFETQKKENFAKAPLPKRSFICNTCGKAFNSMGNLRAHHIVHTKNKMHFSDICRQSFTHKSSLKQRYMSHCGDNLFECEECGKCFSKNYSLLIHARLHTGKLLKCDKCDKGFIKECNYRAHCKKHEHELKETVDTKSLNTCEYCGRRFKFQINLKIHLRRHTGEMPYKCSYCGRKFNSNLILKNHVAAIHTKDYPIRCPICDQGFCQQNKLDYHLRKHYKSKVSKVYQCNICHQVCANSSALKQHYLSHTGEKPFLCSVCGRGFVRKQVLNIHARLHTGEKPYKCEHCNKSFNSKVQLNYHAFNHTGVYPYMCTICDKGFRKRSFFLRHVADHSDRKVIKEPAEGNPENPIRKTITRKVKWEHKCNFCERSFAGKFYLEEHKRTHLGEYPFKCGACDVGFILKVNLISHMEKFHKDKEEDTMKSSRECDICFKKFATPTVLKGHYRRHTGELPCKCEICSKLFNYKINLKNHVAAIHTGDYPFKCSLCDKGFCVKAKLLKHVNEHYSKEMLTQ